MEHVYHSKLGVSSNEIPNFQGLDCGLYIGKTDNIPDRSLENGGLLYTKNDELFFHSKKSYPLNLISNTRGSLTIGRNVKLPLEGESNFFFGYDIAPNIREGSDNILIGREVGTSIEESASSISIGNKSLNNSSIAGRNINVGHNSLSECGTIESVLSIGHDNFTYLTDNFNIGVGNYIGHDMKATLFRNNIIMGHEALYEAKPNAMDNIFSGYGVGFNLSGVNHQNVIIGKKAAYNLNSSIISDNNICLGTETVKDASNISECIFLGNLSGKKTSGLGSIGIGSHVFENTIGDLSYDIGIGHYAGNFRTFNVSGKTPSKTDRTENIFIGKEAGLGDESVKLPVKRLIAIGSLAGGLSSADESVFIGHFAGHQSKGVYKILFGYNSGKESDGQDTIYIGRQTGVKQKGDRNIFLGTNISSDENIVNSVLIGSNITKLKGRDIIALGTEAGSQIVGNINRGIFIGYRSSFGVRFTEENVNWISIGSHAGQTTEQNCNNSIFIGNDAGRSDEGEYDRTIVIGHFAGSFSGSIADSTIIGFNSGLGTKGDHNTFLGSHTGFSTSGEGNIFLGSKAGDNLGEINYRLIVGSNGKTLISGDIECQNLMIGSYVNLGKSSGCLYLPEGKKDGSHDVLYKDKGVLKYNDSLVSYPKRLHMNDILSIPFDKGTHVIKILFFNKESLLDNCILVNVGDNDLNFKSVPNPFYKVSKQNNVLSLEGKGSFVVEIY